MSGRHRRVGVGLGIVSGALGALFLLSGAFPAEAGNKKSKALPVPLLTPAEEAQVRTDLALVHTLYLETATVLQDAQAQAVATRALALVPQLNSAEIAVFRPAILPLVTLREKAIALRDAVVGTAPPPPGPGAPETADFPSAPYSSICGSDRNPTEAVFAAKVALQAAELVWSAASRACEQVAVVLGEGGNTSLACIVADAVLFAAKAVLEDFQFCDEDIDSAEIEGTYDRVGHVHGDVEVVDDKVDALAVQVTDLQAAVAALQGSVEALRTANCEIIRLLHTPQGQRSSAIPACEGSPGFPYSWND